MDQNKKVLIRAGSFIMITLLYVALVLGFSGAVEPANLVYAATIDRVIEKSFDVRPGGLLNLDSRIGSVNVEGWDNGEVRVKIEVEGRDRDIEDIEFHIESSINGVDIRADIPRSRSLFGDWGRGIRVKYTINVPFEYDLKIRTAGGAIAMTSVDGTIDARTSGGGINAENLSGAIDLTTSGGGVRVSTLRGDISLKTSGGSITVEGAYGMLEARTSGGPIRLSEIDAQVDARTSGGGITVSAIGENKGINLRTSGGGISVTLPESIRANLNARTSGGRVSTDFPITVQGTVSGSSLEGTINGGGPEISLRTSGGSIRIQKF
jgi:DUF4097 and DUF4098 domain-containing protein YvlB